jgi:hypothetical protein
MIEEITMRNAVRSLSGGWRRKLFMTINERVSRMKRIAVLTIVLVGMLVWLAPLPVAAQGGSVIPLEYGQTVQGTITNEQYEFHYQFAAKGGDLIYISVADISTSFISVTMALTDSNGGVLAEYDGWNALPIIGPFEVPADGDYFIDLTRWGGADGSSTGNFVLALDRAVVSELKPGTPVDGQLAVPAGVQFWTYEGKAGEILSIKTTGIGLAWMLLDPDGDQVTWAGPTDDPSDDFELLQTDGTYYLMLQTVNLDGSAYTLNVGVYEPVDLEMDQAVDGVLGADLPGGYYRLHAALGQLLRIEVTSDSPDFDGILSIYNSMGGSEAWAYSSAEADFVLLIEPWIAPDEGDYYIAVTPDTSIGAEVPYQIAVRASNLIPLNLDEAATNTLDADNSTRGYALQGTAGTSVTVSVRQVEGACPPLLSIRNTDYASFYLSTNEWATAVTAEMVLPDDGYYVFEVSSNYGAECQFELLVATAQ